MLIHQNKFSLGTIQFGLNVKQEWFIRSKMVKTRKKETIQEQKAAGQKAYLY